MKKLLLASIAATAFCVALAGSCANVTAQTIAAAPDESARLRAIENENAQLKKEIAVMREQLQLRKEYATLKANVSEQVQPDSQLLPARARPVADMPTKAPVYKAVAPVFSWTGCYVGAEAGGAWGSSRFTDVDPAIPAVLGQTEADPRMKGGVAGGTVGCNYQTGSWVWGIEDDLSWTNFKGQSGFLLPFNQAISLQTKTHWLDTLRGRVGYAIDRSLWYVTGGVAFTDTRALVSRTAPGPFVAVLVTEDRTGWVVGGGVEWAMSPRWSLKIEYLFVDYGTKNYSFEPTFLDASLRLKENIVRVGLNYRFGDPSWGKGPVVAKY
jgi:outer membrane immunogenic protein